MEYVKTGIFYLLPLLQNLNNNQLNFKENLVCILTRVQWRLGKTILIACDDWSQAVRIDELLWKFDNDSFLPHKLYNNKNQDRNTPVLIYWAQCCYNNVERYLLINLMNQHMDFFFNFNEIIDFVPTESKLKKRARIRYKFYKDMGFNLSVIDSVKVASN